MSYPIIGPAAKFGPSGKLAHRTPGVRVLLSKVSKYMNGRRVLETFEFSLHASLPVSQKE